MIKCKPTKFIFFHKYAILHIFLFFSVLVTQAQYLTDSLFRHQINSLQLNIQIPYHSIITNYIQQWNREDENVKAERLGLFLDNLPFVDSMLKYNDLPSEFRYIPLATSNMQPRYQSTYFHKAGIWALPYPIAIYYGLRVNDTIDERFDIQKSTQVAVKYLQLLSYQFNSIMDVIVAYANGSLGLQTSYKRIKKQDCDIWTLYEHGNLPDKEIIPNYITAAYMANFYEMHNIQPIKFKYQNDDVDSIILSKSIYFERFKNLLKIDSAYFYTHNSCLVSSWLPENYPIYLPKTKIPDFYCLEDSLYIEIEIDTCKNIANSEKKPNIENISVSEKYHIVKSGDVLGKLATKYHTTVANIKKWNNLNSDKIFIGQKLIVSKIADNQKNIEKENKNIETKQPQKHIVSKGETLSAIAKKYGVLVSELKKWNNLSSDRINIGQQLKIEK